MHDCLAHPKVLDRNAPMKFEKMVNMTFYKKDRKQS